MRVKVTKNWQMLYATADPILTKLSAPKIQGPQSQLPIAHYERRVWNSIDVPLDCAVLLPGMKSPISKKSRTMIPAKDSKDLTHRMTMRARELRKEIAEKQQAVDPDDYPPGELPAVSRDELARIAAQPEKSADDLALLGSEYARAQRKRGFFKALADKRPDADERDMSAIGTVRIAEPVIHKMARHGAGALARSRHGGQKTGAAKKNEGAETKLLVLAAQKDIGSDAKAIGERVGISESQVRRLWRKPPKRNARMK